MFQFVNHSSTRKTYYLFYYSPFFLLSITLQHQYHNLPSQFFNLFFNKKKLLFILLFPILPIINHSSTTIPQFTFTIFFFIFFLFYKYFSILILNNERDNINWHSLFQIICQLFFYKKNLLFILLFLLFFLLSITLQQPIPQFIFTIFLYHFFLSYKYFSILILNNNLPSQFSSFTINSLSFPFYFLPALIHSSFQNHSYNNLKQTPPNLHFASPDHHHSILVPHPPQTRMNIPTLHQKREDAQNFPR